MDTTRPHPAGALPVLPAAEGRGFCIPSPRGRTWRALALSLLVACDGAASARTSPATVIDDAGRVVSIDAPAMRIVSTLPSVTELIIELGAADRLLARTAYDTDARVAHLPSLGRTLTPSTEAIVAYRPDLVIREIDRGAAGSPAQTRLRVYEADVQRIADIGTTLDRLGVLLGLRDRADSLRRALDAGLAQVRARVHGRSRPAVLYLLWPDPPQTAGSGTFVDEIIDAAGGRNVFADLAIEWPEVALEAIVRRNPDFIVLPQPRDDSAALPALHDAPGWRDLSAVRTGRVVSVDADLFNRPGPHVVTAARTLAAALHPDVRFP